MIALIHGYGTQIDLPFRKKHARTFDTFLKIGKEKVALFVWGIPISMTFLQFINPWNQYKLYRIEKESIYTSTVLSNLHAFFQKENPHIIVCHSLGCHVFIEYVKKYSIPKNVEKIVFFQADISYKTVLKDESLSSEKNKTLFVNYFCPYDVALLGSMIINKYIPAGLIGMKNKTVLNRFAPLFLPHIHLSSVRNKKYVEEILC